MFVNLRNYKKKKISILRKEEDFYFLNILYVIGTSKLIGIMDICFVVQRMIMLMINVLRNAIRDLLNGIVF